MTSDELVAGLRLVLVALRDLGVQHFVGGSLASSAHGVPRASVDADVVAALRPEHVGPLAARLKDAFYLDEDRLRDAVERRRSVNVIHLDTMYKIDIFVAKDRAWDQLALGRSQRRSLTGRDEDVHPIASAEDIVLAKLEWFRTGGESSERQWNDVLGVLRAQTGLDEAYLRQWSAVLGVADLMERAFSEAADRA